MAEIRGIASFDGENSHFIRKCFLYPLDETEKSCYNMANGIIQVPNLNRRYIPWLIRFLMNASLAALALMHAPPVASLKATASTLSTLMSALAAEAAKTHVPLMLLLRTNQ